MQHNRHLLLAMAHVGICLCKTITSCKATSGTNALLLRWRAAQCGCTLAAVVSAALLLLTSPITSSVTLSAAWSTSMEAWGPNTLMRSTSWLMRVNTRGYFFLMFWGDKAHNAHNHLSLQWTSKKKHSQQQLLQTKNNQMSNCLCHVSMCVCAHSQPQVKPDRGPADCCKHTLGGESCRAACGNVNLGRL